MIASIVQAKLASYAVVLFVLTLVLAVLSSQQVHAASDPPGTIEGVVSLTVGQPWPLPRTVLNATDPEICGQIQDLGDLVVSKAGGVAHVIVSLSDHPEQAVDPEPPARRVVLDNRNCQFRPRSIVLRAGDTLEMRNSDATLHTVHWYGPSHGNVSLPMEGMRVERTLSSEGMYQIKCDVHGWMKAFVRVDPHRYHAVSDETGAFMIEGVPTGSYTLEAWHERLGFLRERVDVGSGGRTTIRLTYVSEPR